MNPKSTARLILCAGPIVLIGLLLVCGCDEEGPRQRQRLQEQLAQQQKQNEEQQRKVEELNRLREQERRVARTRESDEGADAGAATLAWIATSIALVVMIGLLARERRLRRLLERILAVLLGRKEDTDEGPP